MKGNINVIADKQYPTTTYNWSGKKIARRTENNNAILKVRPTLMAKIQQKLPQATNATDTLTQLCGAIGVSVSDEDFVFTNPEQIQAVNPMIQAQPIAAVADTSGLTVEQYIAEVGRAVVAAQASGKNVSAEQIHNKLKESVPIQHHNAILQKLCPIYFEKLQAQPKVETFSFGL